MRLGTTLLTVLSHWRTHRFQLFTLCIGLAVATALWSGVQALNQQARQSYDRAVSSNSIASLARLRPTTDLVSLEDYVALRRAGWQVSPVIEVTLETNGKSLHLLGIDALSLPSGFAQISDTDLPDASFFTPPFEIIAHPDDRAILGTRKLAPVTSDTALPAGTALTDIAVTAELQPDGLSYLVLLPDQRPGLPPITDITGKRLRLVQGQSDTDLSRLTESFHLNLTAFGFLSFVVGLFIVHSTVGLAFEQRRPMFRTMRACGCSARDLTIALVGELVVFALIAGSIGMVLGYLTAAALLDDVAASLRGLYGARVSDSLSLSPTWWALGLAMSLGGALFAAFSSLWRMHRLPVLIPAQPNAWRDEQTRTLKLQSALGVGLLGMAALALTGSSLVAGFIVMGGVLMGTAMLLPGILSLILRNFQSHAKRPHSRWFWADSQQQIRGLSLALMALLLALSVNIGVGTMVASFRQTFTGWLDQRLTADLYIDGSTAAETAAITTWLETRPEVDAVLPIWNADIQMHDWPVEVYGIRNHPIYPRNWPMLEATSTVWDTLHNGSGVLISEQSARYLDLNLSDTIKFQGQNFTVSGIYSDYGNPSGQMVINQPNLLALWPGVERLRLGVVMKTDKIARLRTELAEKFDLAPDQHYEVASVKANALAVFERTFSVTYALNALTYLVAGIALLTSLLTLSTMRLPQLAPLWAMGVTRRQLGWIELMRALMLALLTSLVALPLGLALAWVLLKVINVAAFGWQLPVYLYPMQWLALLVLALVTAAISALLPAIRLLRVAPSTMLGVFANER